MSAPSSRLQASATRVQQPGIRFLRLLQRNATCFGQRSFAEELEQLCYMRRLELAQLLRLRRQAFLPTMAQEQGKGSMGERTSRKWRWGHTTKGCHVRPIGAQCVLYLLECVPFCAIGLHVKSKVHGQTADTQTDTRATLRQAPSQPGARNRQHAKPLPSTPVCPATFAHLALQMLTCATSSAMRSRRTIFW